MLFDKAMSFAIRPGGREHSCMSRSRHGQENQIARSATSVSGRGLCARLRAHSRAEPAAPAFINTYSEFPAFFTPA